MNVTVVYEGWDIPVVVKLNGKKWEAYIGNERGVAVETETHALRYEGRTQNEALAGLVAMVFSWGQWLRRKHEVAL